MILKTFIKTRELKEVFSWQMEQEGLFWSGYKEGVGTFRALDSATGGISDVLLRIPRHFISEAQPIYWQDTCELPQRI